jgi:hypothetical protein
MSARLPRFSFMKWRASGDGHEFGMSNLSRHSFRASS